MLKRRITIITAILVLAVLAITLVACNPYKQNSIGGGNPDADVVSNGGYYVQQGNYVYFINGYEGESTDNEWGNSYKQAIMRAELDENGNVNNDTATVVVPLNIYNKSTKGGLAVYGNFIYYATPNTDKDKNGTPSTTHTNFMRTSLDGSVTQLIGEVNSRETDYIFTPTRVVYYVSGEKAIKFFDFSGMKGDKSSDKMKGVYSGNLAENVESYTWNYDALYKSGQGAEVTDYFFYTQTVTGDDSYEYYNNLYAKRFDGTGEQLLVTKTTYLTEEEAEDYVKYTDKIFKLTLKASYVEEDGSVALYYSKSKKKVGSTDGTGDDVGLYVNKFTIGENGGMDKANEKQLAALVSSYVYPLGYENGAIVSKDSKYYLIKGLGDSTSEGYNNEVLGREANIVAHRNGYLYYTDSSSATALYKIPYIAGDNDANYNETAVVKEGIKVDWLKLEFVGNKFIYFATDDYNYLHVVDVDTFDCEAEDAEATLIGKMTQADADAKKAAEEEAEDE